MHNLPSPDAPEEKKIYKHKGKKAMFLNIIFFVILFLGIFLVPVAGFATTLIIISLAFVLSILSIYFS